MDPSKQKSQQVFETEIPTDVGILEAGDYLAKCVDIMADTSKSGNPMWVWTFELCDDKGNGTGRELQYYTALTPSAMWKAVEILSALGIPTTPGEKVSFGPEQVLGIGIVLEVVEDEYNGLPTNSIQRVKGHPSGPGTRVAPAESDVPI